MHLNIVFIWISDWIALWNIMQYLDIIFLMSVTTCYHRLKLLRKRVLNIFSKQFWFQWNFGCELGRMVKHGYLEEDSQSFWNVTKASKSFSFKKNVHSNTMSQKTNSKFLKVQDYRSINVYYATL